MNYDVVIIGAGVGGITAGLTLANSKKKVLILEKNDIPGGLATTIRKGRFEFDTSCYELYGFGTEEQNGSIAHLLKKFDISVSTLDVPFNYKIKSFDVNESMKVNGTVSDFFQILEELKKGSLESLEQLLKVTKEIHFGYEDLKKGNLEQVLQNETFMKYIDMNTIDALKTFKMPKETIHRLGYFWIYLESPLHKLNFISFAEFLYELLHYHEMVFKDKSMNFILDMIHRYQDFGGKIYYRSLVTKIEKTDYGYDIVTKDKTYHAKQVICNLSRRYVLKNLFQTENKELISLENARTIAPSTFAVYLGLNRDKDILGLDTYHYYHFASMNSEANYKTMREFYHPTWEAFVPNVVNEFASPKNTSILVIKTCYYGNPFGKVTNANYKTLEMKIAQDLIHQFEEANQIDISPYIEELEIISPYTISNYTNHLNGTVQGYMRLGYDQEIHRILSCSLEDIPNLYFVGSSSIYGGGIHRTMMSGYDIGKKILEQEDL